MIEMFHERTLLLLVGLAFCRAYVADQNSLHVTKAFSRFGPSIEKSETADQELYRMFSQQDYKCTSEGRFVDPDDCGQYYDCIQSNTGELMAHKKSCFDNDFNTTIKACAQTEMVNGCSPSPMKRERTFHFSDSTLQRDCEEVNNGYMCIDCKTLVMCLGGVPFKTPCGPGLFCSTNKPAFPGGVCHIDGPSECTCNKNNIFRKDLYNACKFLYCDTEGSDPVLHTCPGGKVFNEEHRSCGNQAESTCSIAGSFPMISDCTKFYTCILTTEGWLHTDFSCPDANTMFNEKTDVCEDPCSWYTGSVTCKKEGRVANPGDCSAFYECIKDTLNSSKFIQIQHMCPEGYVWGPMANFCVPSSSTTNECVPTKPIGCKIPSGWCPTSTVDPDGFEKLEDGRVIRRTLSSDPKDESYETQMQFCNQYAAQPFVPQTPADYVIYKNVRESLGKWVSMWLPASDQHQEGTLWWFSGELVVNPTLFPWREGQELIFNDARHNCVIYGTGNDGHPAVNMELCVSYEPVYPPICEKI